MIDDSLQNKKTDSVNRANMGLKFVREACKYVNMSTFNINCKNPDEKAKRNTLNSKNKKSEGFTYLLLLHAPTGWVPTDPEL